MISNLNYDNCEYIAAYHMISKQHSGATQTTYLKDASSRIVLHLQFSSR